MTICPCCGQELPAGFVAPREELVGRLQTSSWVFRAIVQRLAWRPGLKITCAELADYVYRDDPEGGPVRATDSIKEIVSRYRHELEPLGWALRSRRGYWLEVSPRD